MGNPSRNTKSRNIMVWNLKEHRRSLPTLKDGPSYFLSRKGPTTENRIKVIAKGDFLVKYKVKGLLSVVIFLFAICTETFCFAENISSYPQRIISLGPSITEQLYLLEVEDKLIGCTVYCQRPPQAKMKEKVGTVTEVDLERILSLEPDLVLATPLTNPKAIKKLRNLGIKVISSSQAKDFTQICEQFLELAKIIGKEKKAEEIIHKVRNRVDTVKKKNRGLPKFKVFVQIGARPLFTVTKDSFANDFIEFSGGINIAKDTNSGLYSREEVLKNNPDIIIIVTMGIVGEEEKQVWQKFKALSAVKNNRIYIVDSYKMCSPTPVTFVETLEEISGILHPEETKNR